MKELLDKCQEWTGAKNENGYGRTCRNGKKQYAHRAAWEISFGPIPDGLKVCHKCDNPSCVNPTHLFLGTQRQNIQDASEKGRMTAGKLGERNGNHKLTASEVIVIRQIGGTTIEISKMFGVTQGRISRIRNRKEWKHI